MAKRGRKPDPPKLKILKANEGRDAGPFAGLREGGAPDKPGTIADDPIASAEWDRVCSLLDGRRTVSPADMANLAAYCSAWSRVVQCRRELSPRVDPKTGEVVYPPLTVTNDETGATKANPVLGVLGAAERSLHSFAATLGLTPTERGRVQVLGDGDVAGSKLEQLNAAASAHRHRYVRPVPEPG